MSNYNEIYVHRTIGVTPLQADENPSGVVLKKRMIPRDKHNIRFRIGDTVRVSTQKGVFTKGYLPNWSAEIFTVIKVNKTLPPTYNLNDYTGKPIAGGFYAEEISKTLYPDDYLVEKIVRRKGDQLFVKWLGFENSHNSWIKASDIRKQS